MTFLDLKLQRECNLSKQQEQSLLLFSEKTDNLLTNQNIKRIFKKVNRIIFGGYKVSEKGMQ